MKQKILTDEALIAIKDRRKKEFFKQNRIKGIPYLYARSTTVGVSFDFRRDVAGKRFVIKVGDESSHLDIINRNISRCMHDIAVFKGEERAKFTLLSFINLYFIANSKRVHRDHQGMLSRLKIVMTELSPFLDKDLESITKFDCIQVIDRLRTRNVSPSTLNKYRYALQAIFSLALEMELIDKNPVRLIKKERVSNIKERVLRGYELERFIFHSFAYANPYCGGALLFLLSTGLRAMEALTLKWSFIADSGEYADLPMTKNGRPRRVFFNNSAQMVLRKLKALQMNEYVFYSASKTGHLSYPRVALNSISGLLADEGVLAGAFSLHTLRHTFASNLITLTGSLRLAQIALGHSSSVTTERYTHYTDAQIGTQVSQLDSLLNYPSTKETICK